MVPSCNGEGGSLQESMFFKVAKSGPTYASFLFGITFLTKALVKWATQIKESKARDNEGARELVVDGPNDLNKKP